MSRLEQLAKIVQEANTGLASFNDIKEIVTVLKGIMREFKSSMEQKMANHKGEMDKCVKDVQDTASKTKDEISAKVTKLESDLRSDIRTTIRMFEQNVKDLKDDFLAEYEDSEIRQELARLDSLVASVSAKFDDSNLRADINELGKEIDELKDDLKKSKKDIKGLQGASMTPSPVHWPRHESFTMNGSDTSVTLAQAVGGAGTFIFGVRYNGQTLDKDNQYTVNGNKIQFSFTPKNSTTISISYMS